MFTKKMSHMIKQKNILIGCTGSVASIKLPNLISELKSKDGTFNVSSIVLLITQLLKLFSVLLDKSSFN